LAITKNSLNNYVGDVEFFSHLTQMSIQSISNTINLS